MPKHNTQYTIHNTNPTYALILVGGKGKRLRPLSTDSRPKAFLSITKDRKTMFRKTVDRLKSILPSDNILVAANRRHAKLVRRDFPEIANGNMLLEPVSRNTAPAITLAAFILKKRSRDALMAVLPTDQYIRDVDRYLGVLKRGIDFVRDNREALLVLGVRPTFPSTQFGYVKLKAKSSQLKAERIYEVEKFVEKPGLETAKRYLKDGRYLWNAGAFIFAAASILTAVEKYAPRIFNGLKDLNRIDENYKGLPDISIDYAVMEKADNIYCVRGSYRWQDMGGFDSLKSVLMKEGRKFVARNGKVVKIL
ncbi:MAG: mannose-1-phosphate guanylyltransferase [Candidatus Omnitrophica bacterium]|nr:mannose-1-phosphate guanylyltransferase [Candidatus Omnitrophota bacterium]